MDFSTNATDVGTNIYSVPSSIPYKLQSTQQSSPMSSSFDYHPTTTSLPVTLSVPTHSFGQHSCFTQDTAFTNKSVRLNHSTGIVNNNNQQVKVMNRSYQPNGINHCCGMKSAAEGGGDMMTTPTPQLGTAFEKSINGSPSATKREKCPVGIPGIQNTKVTFQELTTMQAECRNFAVRAQNSQESANNCRKRRSMSQVPYPSDFYRSDQISRSQEMMDTCQPLPQPQPQEFCFSHETPTQRPMSISNGAVSSNSTSSSLKIEHSPVKCLHIDPSGIRRSPRLTQAQIHQQYHQYVSSHKQRSSKVDSDGSRILVATPLNPPRRMTSSSHFNDNHLPLHYQNQNQSFHVPRRNYLVQRQYALRSYANPQDFTSTNITNSGVTNCFFDHNGNRRQLGTATNTRAPTAAWGQMTKQQQLAIVNNPRWRLPQSVPLQHPSPKPSQSQSRPTIPVRKTSLCGPRRPSTLSGLGMNTTEHSLDRSEALIKPSPSNSNFDTMIETLQKDFDFSMSSELTDTSSANRPHEDAFQQDAYGAEANDEEMTSGNVCHDSDSSQSTFPGEGLPPEQFRFFDEPFSNTWKGVKLTLVQQPELQHRARYLTEGSRGPIKNRTYDGYPTILMQGWAGSAVLHVFVASESDDPNLHLFYQVCLVSTKTNRGCCDIVFGFTTVVQMPFTPNSDNRVMSVDSVGLVKLRNSDVERRCAAMIEESKRKGDRKQKGKSIRRSHVPSSPTQGMHVSSISASTCGEVGRRSLKPKSSSARLVYRVLLLSPENTVEGVVQVISDPIRCTQIVGGPEITRMSIKEADAHSRPELFIIGKNFVRGTRVIFRQMTNDSSDDVRWEMDAEIEVPYFTQTHLVCKVPEYTGPSLPLMAPLRVSVYIQTPTRVSRPEQFTYLPTFPIQGPPIIKRISEREVSVQGMVDMIILGLNFSPSCRVFIRQVTMETGVSGIFGAPGAYVETPSVIWQREAQIKTDDLTQDYLVCQVPPYDGQSLQTLTLSLPVQILIEGPGGTSTPETFFYVQCKFIAYCTKLFSLSLWSTWSTSS